MSGIERSSYKVKPEVTRDPDPAAPTELFYLIPVPGFESEEGRLLRQLRIGPVLAVFIGQNPWNAGFGGGLDEIALNFRRRGHGQSNDEHVLACQGRLEELGGLIVSLLHRDPGRKSGGGVLTRKSRHIESAPLQ